MDESSVPECGPDEWLIHMSSWIIQDGNYDEFSVGDTRAFALEFWTDGLSIGTGEKRAARSSSSYEISGEIVEWGLPFRRANCLDIGALAAYRAGEIDVPSPHVQGLIILGIDPFEYFESLGRLPGAPPLIYDWRITGLYRQTAPFVETAPRVFERDATGLGWAPIESTNALDDDQGAADYLLRATPLGEPRRSLRAQE